MNIASKVTVGLISIVFVGFAVAFAPAAGAANDQEIEALQARLNSLLAQLSSLQGTTPVVTSTGSNAACPYTWARNLSIGSTGDDVRQLQRFLNGNPRTQVAASGTGSPGNESSYYGPATAAAVSKFQELHAAQILTPLGLASGTGGFYTSTRNQANSLCRSGSVSITEPPRGRNPVPVTPSQVSISGDALAVTAGNPIGDSYVVIGAQRVPFTSVVLTAGNDNVRIEGIQVKRFGLSSSDNFESVALVDVNGVQIGSSRSLNSRDEAKLGGNFVVPANRSVTLVIVGNMTSDDTDFDAGAIAGFEVVEVVADSSVQGAFPVRGAAHVLSSSIDLQKVIIDMDSNSGTIEFDEDTEVVSLSIDLGGSNVDEEDAYLRSIILEQIGSADEDEIGDVEVFVEDDRVNHRVTVDRDRYIVTFDGQGVLIEEGDNIDVTIEMSTDMGTDETVQFKIDDVSDVYVIGAEYGYGLPVMFKTSGGDVKDMSGEFTISSGKVRSGGRFDFEDEVQYGDDVVIGALSVEFEGEDVEMEDLVFSVMLDVSGFDYNDSDNDNTIDNGEAITASPWQDADEDSVSLSNVRLRVDGENVAFANDGDIEFAESDVVDDSNDYVITEADIDFSDSFTIDVRRDREVKFELVADLENAWSHFDGTSIQFTLTDVEKAEGVNSEKDYAFDSSDNSKDGYFAKDREFKKVVVIGNQVEFSITNSGVDDKSYVAGSKDVVFATLEVDADDAIDDIDIDNLYISFEAAGTDVTLDHLDDCRVLDHDGDEVADSRGDLNGVEDQARFRFNRYTVDKGEEVELDIVCSIDSSAVAAQTFAVDAVPGNDDRVEYTVNRDDSEFAFGSSDDSDIITVSAGGTLDVAVDLPGHDSIVALAVGSGVDDVETLEITVEAEGEDINIKAIYLDTLAFGVGTTAGGTSISSITDDLLGNLMKRASIEIGRSTTTARPSDFNSAAVDLNDKYGISSGTVAASNLAFERIDEVVEADEEVTFTLDFDYKGLDDDVADTLSGNWLSAANVHVVYEGVTSDAINVATKSVSSDFVRNLVFPAVPTVSADNSDRSLSNGHRKLYEFTVAANKGDIYLNEVGLRFSYNGVEVDDGDIKISGATVIGSTKKDIGTSGSTTDFEFSEPERIKPGESKKFEVWATVTNAGASGDYVTVELTSDTSRSTPGSSAASAVGNFIWSPNTLDTRDDEAGKDWFNGYGVFDGDDVDSWTSD